MTHEGAVQDLVGHANRVVANLHFRFNDPLFWRGEPHERQLLMKRLIRIIEEIIEEAPLHRGPLTTLLAELRGEYVRRSLSRVGRSVGAASEGMLH